jgi:TPP-dependent indolepyruvate ferredoxin oxidoreductase alpha subunit
MIPKPTKIRSKKITQSAKGENCTVRFPGVCNHNPETVVFAHVHSRFSGMGTKSSDIHGCYMCSDCHSAYDRYEVAEIDVMRGMIETQLKLYQKGLIKV